MERTAFREPKTDCWPSKTTSSNSYTGQVPQRKKIRQGKNNGTNGLGQVQHFKYDETKELDLGALSAIEAELNRSAERFENTSTGVSGAYEDYVTVQERNF